MRKNRWIFSRKQCACSNYRTNTVRFLANEFIFCNDFLKMLKKKYSISHHKSQETSRKNPPVCLFMPKSTVHPIENPDAAKQNVKWNFISCLGPLIFSMSSLRYSALMKSTCESRKSVTERMLNTNYWNCTMKRQFYWRSCIVKTHSWNSQLLNVIAKNDGWIEGLASALYVIGISEHTFDCNFDHHNTFSTCLLLLAEYSVHFMIFQALLPWFMLY